MFYNIKQNVGVCKYVVSYHDGVKKHLDDSPFYDIAVFKNKTKMQSFVDDLIAQGYKHK